MTAHTVTAPARPPIRVLDVVGSPEQRGATHGSAHADDIRRYTDERIGLVCDGPWSGGPISKADVLDIASQCLPAHEAFSPALHAEMLAMASAAGITPAEAIVVGGFTDFIDTVRAELGGPHPPGVADDDCTAMIVPDGLADGAGFYAQTWDMHDSATDFVLLLRIVPDDGPAALVFTTTGCLGQIGMNEAGVCVGINNLTGADGKIGVTWPNVVRDVLTKETAAEGRDTILAADLAGAHNFLVFDASGAGFNIEAMPTARVVDDLGDDAIAHTNHTVHPSTSAVEGERDPEQNANSIRRLEIARDLLDHDHIGLDEVMAVTREREAICRVPEPPFWTESSGAAIMRPKTGQFWACWGQPAHNDYEPISFPVSVDA